MQPPSGNGKGKSKNPTPRQAFWASSMLFSQIPSLLEGKAGKASHSKKGMVKPFWNVPQQKETKAWWQASTQRSGAPKKQQILFVHYGVKPWRYLEKLAAEWEGPHLLLIKTYYQLYRHWTLLLPLGLNSLQGKHNLAAAQKLGSPSLMDEKVGGIISSLISWSPEPQSRRGGTGVLGQWGKRNPIFSSLSRFFRKENKV